MAKELYQQRIKTGKENYNSLIAPNVKSLTDPKKSSLRIRIIAEFQDNQGKKARKDIRKYFQDYGFNIPFAGYYVLSFFPIEFFSFLRKRI